MSHISQSTIDEVRALAEYDERESKRQDTLSDLHNDIEAVQACFDDGQMTYSGCIAWNILKKILLVEDMEG